MRRLRMRTIDGPGEIRSTPWTACAEEITAIVTDVRTTGFKPEILEDLPNVATVNGLSLAQLDSLAPESALPEGTIAVSKTELEAAGAETLTIVDGTAYVGVSVRTNASLEVEKAGGGGDRGGGWGKVDVQPGDVTVKDGSVIIAVPANAEKGFMVLESGDATK